VVQEGTDTLRDILDIGDQENKVKGEPEPDLKSTGLP